MTAVTMRYLVGTEYEIKQPLVLIPIYCARERNGRVCNHLIAEIPTVNYVDGLEHAIRWECRRCSKSGIPVARG